MVRYLIKFTKEPEIKFVAHLDFMRTIQRVVRRAGLPAAYSKGFNPHMSLSLAQPLAVGVYSTGDYLDLDLEAYVNPEEMINKLNSCSPLGIKFLQAAEVKTQEGRKVPQSMALIDAARYTIKIKCIEGSNCEDEFKNILKMDSWVTTKKSKKGSKEVDIKTMIKDFKYSFKDNVLIVSTLISCGSRENLSADLLASYFVDNMENGKKEAFVEIYREDMYALKNNKLVSLIKYVS